MRRIRLTVAYDGTNYCGWQIQPNGITIEEVLNKAICKLTGEEIQVIGASRTDSGVHARGNIAVFDTESRIPAERFSYALNQRLPKDIVVVKSDEVDLNWHPRYQDTLKTYEYHIINTKVPIPTERLYNYFVSFDLDVGQENTILHHFAVSVLMQRQRCGQSRICRFCKAESILRSGLREMDFCITWCAS